MSGYIRHCQRHFNRACQKELVFKFSSRDEAELLSAVINETVPAEMTVIGCQQTSGQQQQPLRMPGKEIRAFHSYVRLYPADLAGALLWKLPITFCYLPGSSGLLALWEQTDRSSTIYFLNDWAELRFPKIWTNTSSSLSFAMQKPTNIPMHRNRFRSWHH